MTTLLEIAGQTDVGQNRHDNQDTYLAGPLWTDHSVLLAVIDGVGGYAGGAEAAALARESIGQYMATPTGDTLTMLREAVVFANNQIVQQRQQNPALARMCCVLTVVVADAQLGRLYYVHVGDTRLYRFRQGQLEKITHDHSLVGVREDANQLTEREAMRHPRRNEILRDVGSMPHRVDDPDFLESGESDFEPGDVLLLCSDGLTDMLTRAQLVEVLGRPMPVAEQIEALIQAANEAGGHDNITVVLGRYSAPEGAEIAPALPIDDSRSATASIRVGTQGLMQSEATLAAEALPEQPPKRRWGALVLVVLGVLAGVLWWQLSPSEPTPRPQPVRADSARTPKPFTTIDSTRTP
ncbi:SpoIIE family protein phosphatase [Rudanella paleaurantiibacter]|uniref:SpoIIE family protein phosphatase n=1 Tax=Rudanella paleaurantiibacter TaxID=2614655 RepID=A0A7J5U5Z5_9BACT|nr:protein phosphatase 2C domain-containing protein [Rudanella paleaurantiibacter]KAB7733071.1 SpoIIE family protein phosphatase [Rudanella paleaurantiibacter]